MKRRYKFLLGSLLASYWVACAPAKFTKEYEAPICDGNSNSVCVSDDGSFNKTVVASGGLVDILFVNDNSGSMSTEQNQMADKFTNFIGRLDDQAIDYRIGVITSDVSSRATESTSDNNPANAQHNPEHPNGVLQDGNLITDAQSGVNIIKSSMSVSQKELIFSRLIKRQETLTCEAFLRQMVTRPPTQDEMRANCPSGDERGIFAAHLFMDKNPSSFIRPNSHLAVVFLADEDVRSGLYETQPSYSLEAKDLPENLISKISSKFGSKGLSIHSIIVKDSQCEYAQSIQMGPYVNQSIPTHGVTNQWVKGSIGKKYREASVSTNGVVGDICAPNYASQLTDIGANISDRAQDVTLPCSDPLDFEVTLNPAQNVSWVVEGKILHFNSVVSVGTQINYAGRCP